MRVQSFSERTSGSPAPAALTKMNEIENFIEKFPKSGF